MWSTAITLQGDEGVADVGKKYIPVFTEGAVDVAAGTAHSIVLKRDGTIWGMGRNYKVCVCVCVCVCVRVCVYKKRN